MTPQGTTPDLVPHATDATAGPPATPGSIVVGVDGSHGASQALRWATEQAVLEHRPLRLVHATAPVDAAYYGAGLVDHQAVLRTLHAEARALVDEARAQVAEQAPEVEVGERIEVTDARALLLEEAERAHLLVLGSRGRGHLAHLLLGSVSVGVARHARCPVVVHRPHRAPDEPGAAVGGQGVLLATDAGPDSGPVVELAFRQAELRGLPLSVVHCYWDLQAVTSAGTMAMAPVPVPVVDADAERASLAESLAGMAEKHPDVQVSTTLVRGMPEHHLARAAEQMDLLVVGAHQGSRLAQLMRASVSISVLEHAHCPVAVVPLG